MVTVLHLCLFKYKIRMAANHYLIFFDLKRLLERNRFLSKISNYFDKKMP